MEARVKVESKPRRRSRNGNGHPKKATSKPVIDAVKAASVSLLMKLLLRRSVLMAVGLGTVAAWYVKRRFFRPAKRNFLGF